MAINWGGTTSEQTWSWQVILTLMTWTEGAQGWGTQQGWYIRPQVKLADGYVMLSSCLASIWHGSRRCSHLLEGQVQSNAKTTDDKSFFLKLLHSTPESFMFLFVAIWPPQVLKLKSKHHLRTSADPRDPNCWCSLWGSHFSGSSGSAKEQLLRANRKWSQLMRWAFGCPCAETSRKQPWILWWSVVQCSSEFRYNQNLEMFVSISDIIVPMAGHTYQAIRAQDDKTQRYRFGQTMDWFS